MLPFSLKISWFILSLTGLLSCWVTLWSFGRVVGTKWASVVYCLGTTFAQGIFCLGLVYRIDPFLMAGPFCLAQNALMSAGAFINMGVVISFTLATSMAVRKPKTWGDARRALQWQNICYLPVVVVPALATTSYLAFSFSFGSVRPADGMWCDSTKPEWIRLLGPSGIPFLLSIPVLYLSTQAFLRIRKTNLHLLRSRPECPITGSQHPTPWRKNSRISLREMAMMPVSLALTISRKSSIVSMRLWKGGAVQESVAENNGVKVTTTSVASKRTRLQSQRERHNLHATRTLSTSFPPTPLPLALLRSNVGSFESSSNASEIIIRGIGIGGDTTRNTLDVHDITLQSRQSQSGLSIQEGNLDLEVLNSASPIRANDETLVPIVKSESTGQMSPTNVVGVCPEGVQRGSACPKLDPKNPNLHALDLVTSESVSVAERQDDRENVDLRFAVDVEAALRGVGDKEDNTMAKRTSISSAAGKRSPTSMVFTLEGLYKKPKQPPAGLAPALWRVILFQFAFVFIQFLAFLTTFVDVVSARRTPSRFGSQHVALLLAAWCPVVIFGSLPVVRRNLIPWRPISHEH